QESFEELVKQLKSVKYLEFDVVTPKDMSGAFGPLMDYIELERRKVRFKPKTTGRSILSHVTEMVKGTFAQRKFRIEGKGELGEKQLIDFVDPSPQALDKKDV